MELDSAGRGNFIIHIYGVERRYVIDVDPFVVWFVDIMVDDEFVNSHVCN